LDENAHPEDVPQILEASGGGSEKLMLGVVAVAGGEPRELFRTDDPNGRMDLLD